MSAEAICGFFFESQAVFRAVLAEIYVGLPDRDLVSNISATLNETCRDLSAQKLTDFYTYT